MVFQMDKSYRRSAAYTRDQVQELLELFPEVQHLQNRLRSDGDLNSLFQEIMEYLARIMGGSQVVVQVFQDRRARKRIDQEKSAARAARKSGGVRFEDDEARALAYLEAQALHRAGIKQKSLDRAPTSRNKVDTLSRGLLASTMEEPNHPIHRSRGSPHQSRSSASSRRSSDSQYRRDQPDPFEYEEPQYHDVSVSRRSAKRRAQKSPSPTYLETDGELEKAGGFVQYNPGEQGSTGIFKGANKMSYNAIGKVAQQAIFEDTLDLQSFEDQEMSTSDESYYFLDRRAQQSRGRQTIPKAKLTSSLSRSPRYQARSQIMRQQHPIRMDAHMPPSQIHRTMSANNSQRSARSFDSWGRPISLDGGSQNSLSPNPNVLLSISSSSFEVVEPRLSGSRDTENQVIDISSSSSSSTSVAEQSGEQSLPSASLARQKGSLNHNTSSLGQPRRAVPTGFRSVDDEGPLLPFFSNEANIKQTSSTNGLQRNLQFSGKDLRTSRARPLVDVSPGSSSDPGSASKSSSVDNENEDRSQRGTEMQSSPGATYDVPIAVSPSTDVSIAVTSSARRNLDSCRAVAHSNSSQATTISKADSSELALNSHPSGIPLTVASTSHRMHTQAPSSSVHPLISPEKNDKVLTLNLQSVGGKNCNKHTSDAASISSKGAASSKSVRSQDPPDATILGESVDPPQEHCVLDSSVPRAKNPIDRGGKSQDLAKSQNLIGGDKGLTRHLQSIGSKNGNKHTSDAASISSKGAASSKSVRSQDPPDATVSGDSVDPPQEHCVLDSSVPRANNPIDRGGKSQDLAKSQNLIGGGDSVSSSENSIETLIESIKASAKLSKTAGKSNTGPRADPPASRNISTKSKSRSRSNNRHQNAIVVSPKTLSEVMSFLKLTHAAASSNEATATAPAVNPQIRSPPSRSSIEPRNAQIAKATRGAKASQSTLNKGNSQAPKNPTQASCGGNGRDHQLAALLVAADRVSTLPVPAVRKEGLLPMKPKPFLSPFINSHVQTAAEVLKVTGESTYRSNLDCIGPALADAHLHRAPSSGDDAPSHKGQWLTSKPTEKTNTTTGVVCSQMTQGSHEIEASASRDTDVSSLSAPFDAKGQRTQQMSDPGTKEEKRTFYRSKGNPYYKRYEPARHYASASRSVGSYSTWATNDQEDILVSVSAQTAYVRQSNQQHTFETFTRSESSDSTAVEDIIARCQQKLHVQNQR